MKMHFIIATFCLLGLASPTFAVDAGLMAGIDALSHGFAKVNYQTPKEARVAAFQPLIIKAKHLLKTYPDAPEAMIMDALILSSTAAVEGGVDALIKVREARELLLHAEKINPQALDGAVYTCLGSLYAKVPSWPISFGDQDKARKYLKKALKLDPVSIDANYFYADFLADQGEYVQAVSHLHLALQTPLRAGREDADTGRRDEAAKLLAKINMAHRQEIAAH
ncbi:MAG: tetratricopeptide repeat protein [Sulfuriferula sp.]